MRTLGIVTGSRADFGIYLPLLREVMASDDLRLHLYATGMHLAPEFGSTERLIVEAGIPVAERIEMLTASDTDEGMARAIGLGTLGFAQAFGRFRPDILVLLGDRFEMLAAACAALPFNLPVAHIHGGEVTEGAVDDAIRHALTKLSHLHFASTEDHARRIRRMGEPAGRVHATGALALDNLEDVPRLSRRELETRFGLDLSQPPLLVTFHPVTREPEALEAQAAALLGALDEAGLPVVLTLPNADAQGRRLGALLREYAGSRARAWMVETFGTAAYFSMLGEAAAMVGNSSSGLLEAPSFALPAVNVGSRQRGRTRGANVIDVEPERGAILAGIRRALDPGFRQVLGACANPYRPAGRASRAIADILRSAPLEGLCVKPFADPPGGEPC